jgi:hypothetical protein
MPISSREGVQQDQENPLGRCVVCKESIQQDALVCTHCNSWQDGSRHIARWSATITALLAIAPLWAGAVSLYKIALPQEAEIKMQALACEESKIKLIVTNVGDRPGILGNSSVSIYREGKAKDGPFPLITADGHSIVRPQEAFEVSLEPTFRGSKMSFDAQSYGMKCEYRIQTIVRGFDEKSEELVTTCNCPVKS